MVELETAGPRTGLLKLRGGKPFKLGDVPALPPDVVSWSMNTFDPSVFFEVGLKPWDVAAGSLLVEGLKVPPRSLVMGSPAKVRRGLTDAEVVDIQMYADRYVAYRLDYK